MSASSSSFERPLVSVVIPALNAAPTLPACFDGLDQSDYPSLEIILVSDASTDHTVEIAAARGARTIQNSRRRGAAYSRNVGALSGSGEIIYFVDADVVLTPTAISQAVACLRSGEADAVFGSYTAETRIPDFYSKFKNYQHHYHHQNGPDYVATFWSGSGAITRKAFEALDGFDVALQACEDIEFGNALAERGFRVRLLKDLLSEHLKPYSFGRLVKSDLWGRAVPWTRLIRSGRSRLGMLNTKAAGMASTALTGLLLLALLMAPIYPAALIAVPLCLAGISAWNRGLLRFLIEKRGGWFGLRSVGMLVVHFGICGLGFVLGHLAPRHRPDRAAVELEEYRATVSASHPSRGA